MARTGDTIVGRFDSSSVLVSLFERVCPVPSESNDTTGKTEEMIRCLTPQREITIYEFTHLGLRYMNAIDEIRRTPDKERRKYLKKRNLPAASLSVTLSTRDSNIEKTERITGYNGMMALDFDDVFDLGEAKRKLAALPYVWYVGLSASGRGLYAIIPTDNRDWTRHGYYFNALEEEMKAQGLTVDAICKDATRLRFVSYDDGGIYNEGCEIYTLPEGFMQREEEKARRRTDQFAYQENDEKYMKYAKEWFDRRVPLDDYKDWYVVASALSTLGEKGWDALELVSIASTHYNAVKNRKMFEYAMKSNRSITMGSFYYMCEKYGIGFFDYPTLVLFNNDDEIPAPCDVLGEELEEPATGTETDVTEDYIRDGEYASDDIPEFPAYVFPDAVQEIISKAHYGMNFPLDYIGSSLIVAAGAAVGNSIQVQVLSTWIEKPVIYMAIVGEPGTNKSAPLEFAIKPLEERDDKEMEKYDKLWAKYEKECANAAGGKGVMPTPPDYYQIVLNDFTMEAMMQQHAVNKRGMLVYKDELINFIRNMGRYSSGNDEMTWTSMFNGGAIQNTRKDKRKTKLKNTCVSICGTIQPASLGEFSKGRTDNGFVDRWLFAYPKTPDAPKFKKGCMMPEIVKTWHDIMEKILDLKYDEKTTPIMLSEDAEEKFSVWYNNLADRKKGASNVFRMMSTKMERYCIRLAIVLDAMRYGCGGKKVKEISEWAIEGAIDLVDYYLSCGMKARKHFRLDPLSNLSILQKRIYKDLPMSFETGDGVQVAQEHGMSERTFKYWLHSDFFLLTSRGHYEKRFR